MQTVKINNFSSVNILERSTLTADAAAGQAVLNLEGIQGVAANQYVLIGTAGSENTELKQILSVGGKQVTLTSNLANDHLQYDSVTVLYGNQLRVYRASNVDGTVPADGNFTVQTTINIDYDQPETEWVDTNGSEAYWYKAAFYNSTTLGVTDLAQSLGMRGGNYGNYCSIDDIRGESGFKNDRRFPDYYIDTYRRQAQDEINSELAGKYPVPFTSPINSTIQRVAMVLAAGFLLSAQYQFANQNPTQEHPKVTEARNKLKQIKAGGTTLVDQAGNSLATKADSTPLIGWPNSNTAAADASQAGGERMFRVSDRY